MDISIFTDKAIQPEQNDLEEALGDQFKN